MAMVCSQCAAPLDVAPGAVFAQCKYCGVKVQVQARGVPSQKPGPAAQPQTPPALVFAAIGGVVALGGVMGAVTLLTGSPDPPQLPLTVSVPQVPGLPSKPEAKGLDRFRQPVCALDVNGDGVGDFLGLSGERGGPDRLTVVNGANGQQIWAGEPTKDAPQLACLDSRWFVAVASNFQAELYDARNLGAPVGVLLRDKLDSYGIGQGCARIKTDDGSVQGVQLPGGAAVPCDAKLKRYHGTGHGMIGLTDERTEISRGKRTYKLKKRRQGTSILSVEVEENGKKLWSRELPYASPTFGTAIAAGGGSVAVWGAEPGNTQKGILVGLNEETGEQRYAVPSTLMVSHSVSHFAFNGRDIMLQAWGSLEAYEPDTGKLAWKIGP